MNRYALLLFFLFFFFACNPKQKSEYVSPNFNLVKLADGIYACIHKIGGKAICNVGIIDNGEETIIFDTFLSPKVAEEILLIVKNYGLSPIKYVINSHFHNDHIRGNQVFSQKVKILSTIKTKEMITENEPDQLEFEREFADQRFHHYDSLQKAFKGDTTSRKYMQILLWRPYYETLSKSHTDVKTRLPDVTFENEKSLDGTSRKVQLISRGQGHSEDDLILYLPDDKIIFTGDVVFNECHPYLGHGYPEKWRSYLKQLQSMDITTVVPGHGAIGNKEIIHTMIDYIKTMEDLVLNMIRDKIPLEHAGNMEIPPPFKSWWFDRFFVPNLHFMYNQHQKE